MERDDGMLVLAELLDNATDFRNQEVIDCIVPKLPFKEVKSKPSMDSEEFIESLNTFKEIKRMSVREALHLLEVLMRADRADDMKYVLDNCMCDRQDLIGAALMHAVKIKHNDAIHELIDYMY